MCYNNSTINIYYFRENNLHNLKDIYFSESEVHVWIIRWQQLVTWLLSKVQILHDEEISSVKKFRVYEDRMRSLTGKIVSKILLAHYTGIPQSQIKMSIGYFGKPYFSSANCSKHIDYNISHSKEFVLLAFTNYKSIGADVEAVKEIDNNSTIARHCFTHEENLNILHGNHKSFFRYWTAKESYVKALGVGLNKDMHSFSIQGNRVKENGKMLNEWIVNEVEFDKQYSAHVTVKI